MNEETRYTFDQIGRVTGLPMNTLEYFRKNRNLWWHPKGYTLEEVRKMLHGYPLVERESINPRAYKALELYDRLNESEA